MQHLFIMSWTDHLHKNKHCNPDQNAYTNLIQTNPTTDTPTRKFKSATLQFCCRTGCTINVKQLKQNNTQATPKDISMSISIIISSVPKHCLTESAFPLNHTRHLVLQMILPKAHSPSIILQVHPSSTSTSLYPCSPPQPQNFRSNTMSNKVEVPNNASGCALIICRIRAPSSLRPPELVGLV